MEETQDQIDFAVYANRFYKSVMKLKYVILIIIGICFVGFELKATILFDTVYSSQTVFIASTKKESISYTTSDTNDEFLTTFNNVITGSMMSKVICQELKTDYVPGTVTLTRIPDTNLIELKATAPTPQDAYNVVGCIINNYHQVTDNVMSDATISVLDQPEMPAGPDAIPDYLKSGLMGCGVGLVLGLILAFVMSLMKYTVLNDKDIKEHLHLRALTKIPYISHNQKKYSKISHLLLSNPRIQYGLKQAFHNIRVAVVQDHKKNNSQVFMVTSTLPNEGKTMVSTNLAISLAKKGHKTVLVDLDIRNPSIFKFVEEDKPQGNITDFLNGLNTFDEVLNKYQDLPLDIIYGIKSSQSSVEMLSKDSFKKFIAHLRKTYEYVILDVPPLYLMEDALLVANVADSAVLVVKEDFANIYDILEATDELNSHIPQIVGVVLNQYKPAFFIQEANKYGYGKYGYGKYGYGYGYGRK